jgi:amino-acid N-acetyltransferase
MTDTTTIVNDAKAFVDWFHSVAPYIHAHRGHTFVLCFGGELLQHQNFTNFIQDIALLNSLGIRIVLVYGIRPQIEQCLKAQKRQSHYIDDIRITDNIALNCVKAACGEVRTEIEGLLSKASPSTDVRIRTASGNFIIARPIGVRDGVDYCYTGEIRRIDAIDITRRLDEGNVVLIAPIGYSPTGEIFNLLTESLATEVAIALQAHKCICLTEKGGVFNKNGELIRQLTWAEAQQLKKGSHLDYAVHACKNGVQRVHFISQQINGAVLLELFTRDGIGTLISSDSYENIRQATIDDVGGILELIKPLEDSGILVRRSREKLEIEINHFIVQERDGMIIACAALYPYEKIAELACLAVHIDYRGADRGATLLLFLERKARKTGINQIFVLTTQTAHWFQERGFIATDLDSLPLKRRTLYNYQRKSKLFIKYL